MPKVKINGREVHIPDSVRLDSELRELGGIAPGRNLIRRTKQGNFLVPPGSNVVLNDDEHFIDAPARVKGAARIRG
jgi:hypothetical protein